MLRASFTVYFAINVKPRRIAVTVAPPKSARFGGAEVLRKFCENRWNHI
jgi:hypothetical protein